MRRNSPLPYLVLGLLTLLTVGAVLLGLSLAPATADLVVHNGAGETVGASSLTAVYTSKSPAETVRVLFHAPGLVTEALLEGGASGKPVRSVTEHGASAVAKALGPLSDILKVTGFVARGASFVATEPASKLVAPAEASEVSGSIHYTATVTGGYLVEVVEQYRVTTPGGTESGIDHFKVVRIGGQPAPSA